MKILVASQLMVESGQLPEEPFALVSIRSPGANPAEVSSLHLQEALFLDFYDIDKDLEFSRPGEKSRILYPITPEQGRDIFTFAKKHYDLGTPVLVCQCEAGVSRSAGAAAGVTKALGGNDESFFRQYRPNRAVYRAVLNASQEKHEETPSAVVSENPLIRFTGGYDEEC